MFVFALAPGLRVLHNGETVFQTQPVREPPEDKAGTPEVSELPRTVKGGGIVIDVTVDMLLVRVGRHKKSVTALRPAHSQFIANTVCLFWRYLPGIEGPAYLVTEHVRFLFLFPPRCGFIAGLRKQKFLCHCGQVALIGGEIFTFDFLRVLPIVQAVTDGPPLWFRLRLHGEAGAWLSPDCFPPFQRKRRSFRAAACTSGQHGPRLYKIEIGRIPFCFFPTFEKRKSRKSFLISC